MPEIKFSAEKAERWLTRIEKRLSTLSSEDNAMYKIIKAAYMKQPKLDSQQAKALWELGKKL
jgi:hypothetical protein